MARKAFAAVALTVTAGIVLSGCAGASGDSADNTIDGEVKGDVKVVTWRTDLDQDGTFDKYAAEFNKKYPDVNVTFEGITDYSGEMQTRMRPTTSAMSSAFRRSSPTSTTSSSSPSARPRTSGTPTASSPPRAMKALSTASPWAATPTASSTTRRSSTRPGSQNCPPPRKSGSTHSRRCKDNTDAIPLYTNYKDGWPLTPELRQPRRRDQRPRRAHHAWRTTRRRGPRAPTSTRSTGSSTTSVAAGLTEEDPLTTELGAVEGRPGYGQDRSR